MDQPANSDKLLSSANPFLLSRHLLAQLMDFASSFIKAPGRRDEQR